MRKKMIISLLLLLSAWQATGQQDTWLKTVIGNAVGRPVRAGIFQAAHPGFALYFAQAGDINVPYLVYVPKSYIPAKPISLVVFLHGAILAKDSFQYRNSAVAEEPVFSVAEPLNTIVLFPFAKSDFKWAGQSGAYENVMKMVRQASEVYNIDKQRIFIGGMSMGGNATYWFIDNHPELFAGFYTFSAMPRFPGRQSHFERITNSKPLYSMNAKDDAGFPYSEVRAAYEQHRSEAPGWHFDAVETGGHRFIYAPDGSGLVQSLLGKLLKK